MMATEFTGQVLFATGRPAANVRVRVLDRDGPGKIDDDLTLEEGISNGQGKFTVRYAPSKYLDLCAPAFTLLQRLPFDWARETDSWRVPDVTDVYLPYLRFDYAVKDRPRTQTATLRPLKRVFRLPELPGVDFRPSTHGFRFVNRFTGFFLPFSIPSLPDIPGVANAYGMCGGMAAAALDLALANRPVPEASKPPKRKSPLHRYLYRRQIDSFGSLGDQIVRFARWMFLPDDTLHGTWRQSLAEYDKICARLNDDTPVPVGLVYVSSRDTLEIWRNHQVLAYGFTEHSDRTVDIRVYDPNYPLRDDVVIHSRYVSIDRQDGSVPSLFGLQSEERLGSKTVSAVRGFFAMPYLPQVPPADLG